MRLRCRVSPHMGLLGIACLVLLVVPPPLGASVAGPGSSATAAGFGGGVASPDDEATRVAHDILAAGGTSTDAALGAAAVLGLRMPDVAGLGGGSAVLHVDGRTGAADLVDGCQPLTATSAWRTAHRLWGSDETDVYGRAAQMAHGPLRRTVLSLRQDKPAGAGPARATPTGAAPSVTRLRPVDLNGALVAGGATERASGHVPADAYASVVVADRSGDITAVVTAMGVRGGTGRRDASGVVAGADLPQQCGDALPSVLFALRTNGRAPSPLLAIAPAGGRKNSDREGNAQRAVRAVIARQASSATPLESTITRQGAPVVAVKLDNDGRVHAAGLASSGGSAAVVHDE